MTTSDDTEGVNEEAGRSIQRTESLRVRSGRTLMLKIDPPARPGLHHDRVLYCKSGYPAANHVRASDVECLRARRFATS
jgi:hypothetical protein